MQLLNPYQCATISGGLTEKQLESLIAKAGGYAAKAAFLSVVVVTTKVVSVPAFLVGAIAAPIASLTGTYLFYENQDYVISLVKENLNIALQPTR